jgi:endonuclease/exonuclease/phosphatase family metal-dependent hydrolase
MRALLLAVLLLLAAPLHAAEFKLATWNIAWLTLRPAGDEALPRSLALRQPEDFARLADYARRLDADIVALQEVDGAQAAARVFDPGTYAFFFTRENDVQRTGFAIRHRIAATQNEDLAALDIAPGARPSQRRGADVTVTLQGRPFRLLSVHLNAGCREGPMDAARNRECEGLARQAEVLAGWIAARRREGIAFAVLGDFNRRMDHPRDEMTATLAAAAPLTRANAGASNPCWADARGARPFIDHILLGGAARDWMQRGSLRVMVYAERDPAFRDRLSDHCPVSIRLRVP